MLGEVDEKNDMYGIIDVVVALGNVAKVLSSSSAETGIRWGSMLTNIHCSCRGCELIIMPIVQW